jgi:predicted O-methyltransferase YrrM
MKSLLKFLTKPVYQRYQQLNSRISSLEREINGMTKAFDFLADHPKWLESEQIGFNGQQNRKKIFQDVIKKVDFDAIIETGTWNGNTTGYMAKMAGLPVYTCELVKPYYSVAKMRLQEIAAMQSLYFHQQDSRSFLKELASTELSQKKVFIYLDAHWYEDLPLREELELIGKTWKESVIMIDDFQVPGDPGYGYDNYGIGKKLTLDLILDLLHTLDLVPFFPALSSEQETGAKRGCIVLTRKGKLAETLSHIPSLIQKDTSN